MAKVKRTRPAGRGTALIPIERVERSILMIRGQKVLLDLDLSELYGVPVRQLNQAVKRNIHRFPADFMFQLTLSEAISLKSQSVISKKGRGGRRHTPYAFTELGVAMLSSVLNSERAVQMNIFIMRAFVKLRQIISGNKDIANKVNKLELDQMKQELVLAEVYSVVRKFMDAPMPAKEKIGFDTSGR